LKGGRYSEFILLLIFVGPYFGWSLLTGGRCLEVVVSTGLTVYKKPQVFCPENGTMTDGEYKIFVKKRIKSGN
jgi:hypothetical protein